MLIFAKQVGGGPMKPPPPPSGSAYVNILLYCKKHNSLHAGPWRTLPQSPTSATSLQVKCLYLSIEKAAGLLKLEFILSTISSIWETWLKLDEWFEFWRKRIIAFFSTDLDFHYLRMNCFELYWNWDCVSRKEFENSLNIFLLCCY